jgi:hypothetical protein
MQATDLENSPRPRLLVSYAMESIMFPLNVTFTHGAMNESTSQPSKIEEPK